MVFNLNYIMNKTFTSERNNSVCAKKVTASHELLDFFFFLKAICVKFKVSTKHQQTVSATHSSLF